MTCQLVAATEPLGTARECTDMRLFAGVRAYVSSLVFKAVERLVTNRTFVGPWQLRIRFTTGCGCVRHVFLAKAGRGEACTWEESASFGKAVPRVRGLGNVKTPGQETRTQRSICGCLEWSRKTSQAEKRKAFAFRATKPGLGGRFEGKRPKSGRKGRGSMG